MQELCLILGIPVLTSLIIRGHKKRKDTINITNNTTKRKTKSKKKIQIEFESIQPTTTTNNNIVARELAKNISKINTNNTTKGSCTVRCTNRVFIADIPRTTNTNINSMKLAVIRGNGKSADRHIILKEYRKIA